MSKVDLMLERLEREGPSAESVDALLDPGVAHFTNRPRSKSRRCNVLYSGIVSAFDYRVVKTTSASRVCRLDTKARPMAPTMSVGDCRLLIEVAARVHSA